MVGARPQHQAAGMDTDLLGSVALGGLGLYVLLAFVVRSVLQRRRTGSTGWKFSHARVGSAQWWVGVLLVLSALGLVAAPVVATLTPAQPVGLVRLVVGAVAFALGLGVTVIAQLAMGDAWRIGVDPSERTDLRTTGPFAWCRNPIFTGTAIAALALAVWFPWAAAAWILLVVAFEVQVRRVEEPYLRSVHGEAYDRYCERTGRFIPGL